MHGARGSAQCQERNRLRGRQHPTLGSEIAGSGTKHLALELEHLLDLGIDDGLTGVRKMNPREHRACTHSQRLVILALSGALILA